MVVPVKATVANLTLLAFGSSVPEILLSEIVTGRFFAGGLAGPSTVVASAAFNLLLLLFLLLAVVLLAVVLAAELRIEGLGTYAYTAVLSVSLVVILRLSSPNVLGLREALSTFAMFPLLVLGKAKLGAACQAKPTLAMNFSMAVCSVAGGSTVTETTAIGNGERAAPVTVVNCKAPPVTVQPLTSQRRSSWKCPALNRAACVALCFLAMWEGVADAAAPPWPKDGGWGASNQQRGPELGAVLLRGLEGADSAATKLVPASRALSPVAGSSRGEVEVEVLARELEEARRQVRVLEEARRLEARDCEEAIQEKEMQIRELEKAKLQVRELEEARRLEKDVLVRELEEAIEEKDLLARELEEAKLQVRELEESRRLGALELEEGIQEKDLQVRELEEAKLQDRELEEVKLEQSMLQDRELEESRQQVQELEEPRLQVGELKEPRLQVQELEEPRRMEKYLRVRETDAVATPGPPGPLGRALLPELGTMDAERRPSDAVEVWRPRALTTVTVSTQSALNAALASGTTIELAANINLTTTVDSSYGGSGVYISGKTGLVIDGMGVYKVDGQGSRRCFYIDGGSEVALQGLTITNGYVVSCSINCLLCSKSITQDI